MPDPILKIPAPSQRAILRLGRMADSLFTALLDALKEAKPDLSTFRFQENVIRLVPALEDAEDRSALEELFNIHAFGETFEREPGEVARMISASVGGEGEPGEALAESGAALTERLRSRIEQVLTSARGFLSSAKARSVISEHERLYSSARILSDLRPVFDKDADDVCALAAVHTLCLKFSQDNEQKSFFVTLDDADLEAMKSVLDRAVAKAKKLKVLTEKTEIPYLTP